MSLKSASSVDLFVLSSCPLFGVLCLLAQPACTPAVVYGTCMSSRWSHCLQRGLIVLWGACHLPCDHVEATLLSGVLTQCCSLDASSPALGSTETSAFLFILISPAFPLVLRLFGLLVFMDTLSLEILGLFILCLKT